MTYLYLISFTFIIAGLILLLFLILQGKKKPFKLIKNTNCHYAVCIPAKDESKVIESLLISLSKQANMQDVYIVVEDPFDPTIDIAKRYKANIFIRTSHNKNRKGYAIDELIKDILKNKQYDLYFIFDADNILEDNYIAKMLKCYKKGYEVATGYRNIKNNYNIVANSSILTFSMINNFINKHRNRLNKPITLSGTGLYISGNLINKWQGFPFHCLTEDYELSLYLSANNIASYYDDSACFFDEQPTNLKTSIQQRTRWIKGFLEARKKRLGDINDFGKLIGIIPYLFILLGLGIIISSNIINLIYCLIINNKYCFTILGNIIISLFIFLFILIIVTIIILLIDKKLNITIKQKRQLIFYHPLFLLTYIICFIKAITTKDMSWGNIKHGED
ncbi:MAG: glycosyltransferase family 2 protein [Bacilli bacterium]